MLNPTYLARSENGIFYVRWPLPKHLHPQNKASAIKLSLKTREPKKALRLARMLIQIGERLNEDGIARGMRYDELRALVAGHFRELLEKRKAKIDAEGRPSVWDRSIVVSSIEIAEQAKRDGTPLSLVTSDDEMLRKLIEKFGVDIPQGSTQYQWLSEEVKTGYVSHLKQLLDYDTSLDSYQLTPLSQQSIPEHNKQTDQKWMSIAELAINYIREKQTGDNWVARTKLEKADHVKLLEEILGKQTDVRRLTPMDAKKVKDTLSAYPKNRFKKPETKGKPLSEVLSMQNVERIQVPTINKHLQTYNDMFEWGRRNGFIGANHFSGIAIRHNKKRAQTGRKPFSPEQIKLLLETILKNKDGLIRKDYQKWGPLIGLYTGARLNEIAQIDLSDIREEKGVLVFDLNDHGEGKQLKTAASRRLVPVHSRLIEFGLLTYVEKLKSKGATTLFPDFPNSVEHGRGRNLGRWFNEKLLPKLGIKSEELVFHSLRHTIITALMHADVPEQIVKAIAGHQQQGVTQQHYFRQGYTIQQLNEALQKLRYET